MLFPSFNSEKYEKRAVSSKNGLKARSYSGSLFSTWKRNTFVHHVLILCFCCDTGLCIPKICLFFLFLFSSEQKGDAETAVAGGTGGERRAAPPAAPATNG